MPARRAAAVTLPSRALSSASTVTSDELERDLDANAEASAGQVVFPHPLPSLKDVELAAVEEAMRRAGGNRSAAARLLGVTRPTIARHLKRRSEG